MERYSVLMSVYYMEKAEYLAASLDSIWAQTAPAEEVVLVCDGPLTPELDAVIAAQQTARAQLRVHRLAKNGGLGNALNAGLALCRCALVARMDSDDISRPDRCERQLRVFRDHPEVDIVSGTVEEFSDTPAQIQARRVLPETHEEILDFARKRNPFNHPCVMYRASAVEAAGGYRDFYLLEDYYLWIRMLQNGSRGYNLPQPLLWMRAGSAMYRRRAGRKYAESQRALLRYMRDTGFISAAECDFWSLARTAVSLMPNGMRELAFRVAVRR